MSFPGYLNSFPLDYQELPDEFLASDNFIDFAVEQGWSDAEGDDEFDSQEVYAGWQPNERQVTPKHPEGNNGQADLERERR